MLEGQAEFAELLRRILEGEEVIISQAGTPIARIVPIAEQTLPRIPGLDRGQVTISPDFDVPLPQIMGYDSQAVLHQKQVNYEK